MLVLALAAMTLALAVTPKAAVSVFGQSVKVGAVAPSIHLGLSGPGQADLFGEGIVETVQHFEGPVRPLIVWQRFNRNEDAAAFIQSGSDGGKRTVATGRAGLWLLGGVTRNRGHELCTDESWVQGMTDPAPFHPRAAGELAIPPRSCPSCRADQFCRTRFRVTNMGQPIVQFEIIGTDPGALRGYYGELFGWEYDTSPTVAKSVSRPGEYGFVERDALGDGAGIAGGVGGGAGHEPRVLFYVGVPAVAAALARAEALGGQRRLGPDRAPGRDLVVAQFTDPEGNLIGLAGPG